MEFLKQNAAHTVLGTLLAGCIIVWSALYAQTPHHTLTFAMLNVGQGDSLYIEGPTGIQIVIDAGPDGSILRELPNVMPLYDRSLDAVIETHPDADHIAGFADLLRRYEVGAFIEPGIEKNTVVAKNLEREIVDEKIPRIIARRGMRLDLGGGAQLHILFPDYDVTHIAADKDNDGGIVAHLVYGNTSVLLTADTSSAVEEHLMAVGASSDLRSTILKVGHHGSRFSTEDSFVTEVAPQIALISVGAHNTYGHPTQRVLGTLVSHSVKTFRTDENGTVTCTSDGAVFSCSTKN